MIEKFRKKIRKINSGGGKTQQEGKRLMGRIRNILREWEGEKERK